MRLGGVQKYLEEAATNVVREKAPVPEAGQSPQPLVTRVLADNVDPPLPAATRTRRTQVPETAAPGTEPARPGPTPPPEGEVPSAGPSQSFGSPSQQKRSFIPSSQPDDTAARQTVEPIHVEAAEVPLPAQPTSTAKRASHTLDPRGDGPEVDRIYRHSNAESGNRWPTCMSSPSLKHPSTLAKTAPCRNRIRKNSKRNHLLLSQYHRNLTSKTVW